MLIRTIVKLCVFALVVAAFLDVATASAQPAFVANGGSDSNPCTAAQPCATLGAAFSVSPGGAQIICPPSTAITGSATFSGNPVSVDCPGVYMPDSGGMTNTADSVLKVRNLIFNGENASSGAAGITINSNDPRSRAGGVLVIENCVFENFSGPALDIEPMSNASNGVFQVFVINTRISTNSSGVLLKPAAGMSINATFDHVTITNNSGGGLHADSSSGPITVDIVDSAITDNSSNGFNVTSGTGTQNNVVNIARSTIARNGLVGIQAGGSNAAVLVDTTLLDSNTSGATLAGNGARILSYGNNRIVGSAGSGFTGTAPLQ